MRGTSQMGGIESDIYSTSNFICTVSYQQNPKEAAQHHIQVNRMGLYQSHDRCATLADEADSSVYWMHWNSVC